MLNFFKFSLIVAAFKVHLIWITRSSISENLNNLLEAFAYNF